MATKLQAWGRMFLALKTYKQLQCSVVVMQRVYRGYRGIKARDALLKERQTTMATRLQAWGRKSLALASYKRQQRLIIVLQKTCRGYRGRVAHAKLLLDVLHTSARRLQTFWRMSVETKKFSKMVISSLLIQKTYRSHLARQRYEALLRANVAAAVIQVRWDDYRERKAASLYNDICIQCRACKWYSLTPIGGGG